MEYFVRLSKAEKSLGRSQGISRRSGRTSHGLREGEYRALQEEKERLEARRDEKRIEQK